MQTRNSLRALAGALAVLILSACAALGVPEPRDFNDRASLAYDVAAEGVATTRAMLAAGQLTADDAENAIASLETYLAGVQVARDAHAVSAADGEARLAAIRAGLAGLIEYLEQREASHGGN